MKITKILFCLIFGFLATLPASASAMCHRTRRGIEPLAISVEDAFFLNHVHRLAGIDRGLGCAYGRQADEIVRRAVERQKQKSFIKVYYEPASKHFYCHFYLRMPKLVVAGSVLQVDVAEAESFFVYDENGNLLPGEVDIENYKRGDAINGSLVLDCEAQSALQVGRLCARDRKNYFNGLIGRALATVRGASAQNGR